MNLVVFDQRQTSKIGDCPLCVISSGHPLMWPLVIHCLVFPSDFMNYRFPTRGSKGGYTVSAVLGARGSHRVQEKSLSSCSELMHHQNDFDKMMGTKGSLM